MRGTGSPYPHGDPPGKRSREPVPPPHSLSDRSFGLLFGVILSGITALGWFLWDESLPMLGAAGGVLLVLALPPVTNTLILGLFFYLVLAPLGLVARLFRSDPLQRRRQPEAESYWAPVKRQVTTETLKDMF